MERPGPSSELPLRTVLLTESPEASLEEARALAQLQAEPGGTATEPAAAMAA